MPKHANSAVSTELAALVHCRDALARCTSGGGAAPLWALLTPCAPAATAQQGPAAAPPPPLQPPPPHQCPARSRCHCHCRCRARRCPLPRCQPRRCLLQHKAQHLDGRRSNTRWLTVNIPTDRAGQPVLPSCVAEIDLGESFTHHRRWCCRAGHASSGPSSHCSTPGPAPQAQLHHPQRRRRARLQRRGQDCRPAPPWLLLRKQPGRPACLEML